MDMTTRARQLVADSIVWDMVWPLEPWCGNGYDKLQRFKDCGYNLISLTIAGDDQNTADAFKRLSAARRAILANPQQYRLVETVDDVTAARAANLLGVALHFEGTQCFERNLDAVESFYKLGVRHTLLAFNVANAAGGGCADDQDIGLTAYGRRLVREMERVGMLLDLSHTGYRTTMDALEMAENPVVFTHSNANALADSFRNLRDEQIVACAATGGLVGISGSSSYLGDPACRSETVVRHIDYIAQKVGAQHVGIGFDAVFDAAMVSDFARKRPDEWPVARDPNWSGFAYVMPEQLPEVVELLLRKGYADEDVRAILGENYMRICRKVWK